MIFQLNLGKEPTMLHTSWVLSAEHGEGHIVVHELVFVVVCDQVGRPPGVAEDDGQVLAFQLDVSDKRPVFFI